VGRKKDIFSIYSSSSLDLPKKDSNLMSIKIDVKMRKFRKEKMNKIS
jgi:hypothetical protein